MTITLSKGNHVLELFGSEGCCDGTTKWTFQVNGGEWLDFTTENLNLFAFETLSGASIFINTFEFKMNPLEDINLFI